MRRISSKRKIWMASSLRRWFRIKLLAWPVLKITIMSRSMKIYNMRGRNQRNLKMEITISKAWIKKNGDKF